MSDVWVLQSRPFCDSCDTAVLGLFTARSARREEMISAVHVSRLGRPALTRQGSWVVLVRKE
jgi:hypothetical protein